MAMRSEDDGRSTPPFQDFLTVSPAVQTYTPPEKSTRRMSGFKPANCSEHDARVSNLSTREAYTRMIAHINQDPHWNCCTLEADNQVIFWKATVLPVKLKKTNNSTVFFYAEGLELK